MSDITNAPITETPEVETKDKHEKFQENSAALIKKAIYAIENVGKVSNKKNFEYSEEEVETMFAALEEAIADTKPLFKQKKEFSW